MRRLRRLAIFLLFLGLALLFAFTSLWSSYERPSLVGNGPEDLTSLAILSLFIPAVRRAIGREYDHLHAKLDHLIDTHHHIMRHHPDIPEHDAVGVAWADKRPARGRPGKATA